MLMLSIHLHYKQLTVETEGKKRNQNFQHCQFSSKNVDLFFLRCFPKFIVIFLGYCGFLLSFFFKYQYYTKAVVCVDLAGDSMRYSLVYADRINSQHKSNQGGSVSLCNN